MEVNYVDQYISRRKAAEQFTTVGVSQEPSASQAAVDRAVKGVGGVKNFVDRTDALHLQLATFEDKMLNLTKLVKLSQTLSEEKEADLRKENHDLKVRLRRQEQLTSKLLSDVRSVEQHVPQLLHERLQTTTGQLHTEINEVSKALSEAGRAAEEKNNQDRSKMVDAIFTKTDEMLSERMQQLEADSISRLREAASEHSSALEAVQHRFDLLEQNTLEQMRQQSEDRVASVTNAMRDAIMAEVRTCVRAVNDDLHEEVQQMKVGLGKVEDRCSSLETALTEFIQSYRENTVAQTAKIDETGQGVKELVALQEQTREVVGGELERTKEWATRNMHRLKKHIDTLNAEIQALRESHTDMSSKIERLKHQHSDERERLSAMLASKSKEAAVLTQMVDNEIVGIQSITHSHRQSPVSSQPAGQGVTSASSVSQQSFQQRSQSHRGDGISGMAFNHPKAEVAPSTLYDDLAFARQRDESPSRK